MDVRCSEEIFKQLSQSYLKFRNTARYCLGNLDGFDADRLVAPEEMLELDRWAVTRLNRLTEVCLRAYGDYEFHVVSHAINDFCVGDLSAFYLDIIKDRLYCDGRDSLARRSAQTALFLILDTMTKLFAPILAFTCDEIWLQMPHRSSDDARNVLLNEMNPVFAEYALADDAMARWDVLAGVRSDVNGILEQARAAKRIGKALEAEVRLFALDAEASEALRTVQGMDLADLFLVSDCQLAEGKPDLSKVVGAGERYKGLTVEVSEAAGTKCPRCWKHSTAAQAETGLCPRCAAVIAEMDLELD